jgi:hypothetical protein
MSSWSSTGRHARYSTFIYNAENIDDWKDVY